MNITTIDSGTYKSMGEYCTKDFHVYPKSYAGDPQYAAEYFSHCICGAKRKVTTVKEIDSPVKSMLAKELGQP